MLTVASAALMFGGSAGCGLSIVGFAADADADGDGGPGANLPPQGDNPEQGFAIGGTIEGLYGSGLVLRNNGKDDLTIEPNGDGTFLFATRLEAGDAYAVTIAEQPSRPWQTCTVQGGAGTVQSKDVTTVAIHCVTDAVAVGGTVTGLFGSGLVLQSVGGDALPITKDGDYWFATPIEKGDNYAVTIASQPTSPWQTCTLAHAEGIAADQNIADVDVTCTTNTYAVGGTLSGLPTGTDVTLQLNDDAEITRTQNGTFEFPTQVASGSAYSVTVKTPPTDGGCRVNSGTGTVANVPVSDITIECIPSASFDENNGPDAIRTYTVPLTGTYRIQARGARGGGSGSRTGGAGANGTGNFALTKGDTLAILVGRPGAGVTSGGGGGGGGGASFVKKASEWLIVAGGGGGAGTVGNGASASMNANGGNGLGIVNGGGSGGQSGNGGQSANAAGGGGIIGNGENASNAEGGQSLASGGAAGWGARSGGIGGGGGSGGLGGGGGGGYSGGGSGAAYVVGGGTSAGFGGGGGGSFSNGADSSFTTAPQTVSEGLVKIVPIKL